jgi:hypothetical protein
MIRHLHPYCTLRRVVFHASVQDAIIISLALRGPGLLSMLSHLHSQQCVVSSLTTLYYYCYGRRHGSLGAVSPHRILRRRLKLPPTLAVEPKHKLVVLDHRLLVGDGEQSDAEVCARFIDFVCDVVRDGRRALVQDGVGRQVIKHALRTAAPISCCRHSTHQPGNVRVDSRCEQRSIHLQPWRHAAFVHQRA